ncbi:MAG: Uma2 family endonuclease [Myxococcaceae bacterium]|nr:Uma2 family endonuclease [Myxococcaceae bacterium]
MTTARRLHYSYEEYLEALKRSELKLEFHAGNLYAMAGGTVAHAALSANATFILRRELKPCTVFSSDLKVRIERTDMATFPDVSVVCGPVERSPIDAHALTNPIILVEVTSRSTEDYDRGEKLSHYQQIPAIRAVVIVSHRQRSVTVIRRAGQGWVEQDMRAGELVELTEPKLTFSVDELYEGVTLEAA